ncbi:MAG: MFS transporter [Vulcanimicrobiaceae bacterium]
MRSTGFWVLLATVLGSSLVFIDGTVVSIALPVMQTQLHASSAQALWVVEGYTLVLSALMLLCGALADRYGRKKIFLTGVVLFATGSLACGLSSSIGMLLAARILQGVGGTLLAPASLALLGAHFDGAARAKAIGTWSALTALASTIGPIAGGIIVDHFSWRWVFGINLPIAALILAAGFLKVEESQGKDERGALDVAGSAFITLALGAIVFGFIQAGITGWSNPAVIAAILIGPAALGIFLLIEHRAKNPIMPLALFAGRTFTGVNLLTLLLYGALSGLFYFLPFVLIQVKHYAATTVGLAMMPLLVLIILLSRGSGALIGRFGAKRLLVVGPLLSAAGFACFAFLPGNRYWDAVLPGILLIGTGMGMAVAPLTTTMMESVNAQHVGLASGINSAISRIAGLIAVAVFGVILASLFNARLTQRVDDAHVSTPARIRVDAQRSSLAGATIADVRLERFVLDSYSDGFRAVALGCALSAALGGLVAALLIEKQPKPATS